MPDHGQGAISFHSGAGIERLDQSAQSESNRQNDPRTVAVPQNVTEGRNFVISQ
jgi:hypothetical protein